MPTLRAVRHDYTLATTNTFADQRIARINTAGVVTPSVIGRLLADCQADVARLGSHALMADYSAATLVLDPEAVMRSVRSTIGNGGHLRLPTALIVTPDTAPFWRSYAWMMADHGIVRGVFTDAPAARAWAQEQAQVFQVMGERLLQPPR